MTVLFIYVAGLSGLAVFMGGVLIGALVITVQRS